MNSKMMWALEARRIRGTQPEKVTQVGRKTKMGDEEKEESHLQNGKQKVGVNELFYLLISVVIISGDAEVPTPAGAFGCSSRVKSEAGKTESGRVCSCRQKAAGLQSQPLSVPSA